MCVALKLQHQLAYAEPQQRAQAPTYKYQQPIHGTGRFTGLTNFAKAR